jgi:hypothetical protein
MAGFEGETIPYSDWPKDSSLEIFEEDVPYPLANEKTSTKMNCIIIIFYKRK